MTKSEPATLPARSLASSSTRSAISCGWVNRPVAVAATACLGHLPRVAARRAGNRFGHAVGPEPQIGGHRAGADRVDPDALRPDLLGQRLAEIGQGGLRRAVVDHGRVGQKRVHRTDRHDGSAPGGEHRRQRRAGRPHGGHQVEGQRFEPFLVADLEESVHPRRDRADVVDQDVQLAASGGRRDEVGRPLGGGQIDFDLLHLPGFGEISQCRRCFSCARDDVRSFAGQRARDGQADTFAGAGDNCDFAVQT